MAQGRLPPLPGRELTDHRPTQGKADGIMAGWLRHNDDFARHLALSHHVHGFRGTLQTTLRTCVSCAICQRGELFREFARE